MIANRKNAKDSVFHIYLSRLGGMGDSYETENIYNR